MNRVPLLVSLFIGLMGAMITGSGLAYCCLHFKTKAEYTAIFLAGAAMSVALFGVSYLLLTAWKF